MSAFVLNPAFESTSERLGDLTLSHARFKTDGRFPWIILIPRLSGVEELEDLSAEDRVQLMDEILAAGRAVRAVGEALGRPVARLNIGMMGNKTPQMHLHVLGRSPDDALWPRPPWGIGETTAYAPGDLALAAAAARTSLGLPPA